MPLPGELYRGIDISQAKMDFHKALSLVRIHQDKETIQNQMDRL